MARTSLRVVSALLLTMLAMDGGHAASSRLLSRIPINARKPSRTSPQYWGPQRVEAPQELLEQNYAQRFGRLGHLARLLEAAAPAATTPEPSDEESCDPGDTWRTECGKCYCTAEGVMQCVGDDCGYLTDHEGDGSILDLGVGDEMDLQALSSERHVIVLLP